MTGGGQEYHQALNHRTNGEGETEAKVLENMSTQITPLEGVRWRKSVVG